MKVDGARRGEDLELRHRDASSCAGCTCASGIRGCDGGIRVHELFVKVEWNVVI